MLDINVPAGKCPIEVLIAFPESLHNPEKRAELERLWLCGNEKDYFHLTLIREKKVTAICRLTHVAYNLMSGSVSIRLPAGVSLPVRPSVLWKLGGVEDIVQKLSDYLMIRVVKLQKTIEVTDIQPLYGVVDMEKAKQILDTGVNPFDVLILGLGYRLNNVTRRLLFPRILTWFKAHDGKPIHVCQLTQPESGKTHFGLRSETLFNWEYVNEPPSSARLVMDARSGALGIVYLRDGIVFDEFDKWSLFTDRVEKSFDILLTGMEQGKWTRGTTKLASEAPDIRRLLPILFFGNSETIRPYLEDSGENTRIAFATIYTDQFRRDCKPLADRLAMIDVVEDEIRITDHLTYKVLPDGIIRGIVEIIQSRVKPVNTTKLQGRLRRHSEAIQAVTHALGLNYKPETVDKMVWGVRYSVPEISEGGEVKRG